jgi:glycosyltransferase involved in cell wall biosynthesis
MKTIQIPRRFVVSDWGGTETVLLETSKRLLEMGHDTEILTTNMLSNSQEEVIDGVKVSRTPYFYPYIGLGRDAKLALDKKGGNIFSFPLLKKLVEYKNLDIIHLHTLKRLGGIGRYIAQKRNIPYIVSLHGGVYDVPEQEKASLIDPTRGTLEWGKILGWWVGSRRVLDDASAILCVGKQEQIEISKRYPGKKILFLPNGVDMKRFAKGDGKKFRRKYGLRDADTVVLTVGRIDQQKNQLFIIKQMPEMLKIYPDIRYVVVGHVTNDRYYEEIKTTINKLALENKVIVIPGFDSASNLLTDAYHGADIFLLPSIHEPFGIVILEAWAALLPVIASNVGGIPSFVENGKDGILFKSNNVKSFFDSIRLVVEDKTFSSKLSRNGRTKAEYEYDWRIITNRLLEIYAGVIDENPFRK